MGVKITLKLLFTVNKTWRRRGQKERQKGGRQLGKGRITRMCFLLRLFIIVTGSIGVCIFTFCPDAVRWYTQCGCSVECMCMCRALILASTSNYLNCAYRSYCTVHFPLESYTLSSCLPAALAREISTLGNFVLHNKYCTWGMFLNKNVWTKRKTAF